MMAPRSIHKILPRFLQDAPGALGKFLKMCDTFLRRCPRGKEMPNRFVFYKGQVMTKESNKLKLSVRMFCDRTSVCPISSNLTTPAQNDPLQCIADSWMLFAASWSSQRCIHKWEAGSGVMDLRQRWINGGQKRIAGNSPRIYSECRWLRRL